MKSNKEHRSRSRTPTSSTRHPRAQSPLSPTRHSRIVEKKELQRLNDRLVCYIERVRVLESENSGLSRELNDCMEAHGRESTNIKSLFESELSDARKLLDETSNEKARLQIDVKRLFELNVELQAHLDKATKKLNAAKSFEQLYIDLQSKFNSTEASNKKALEENEWLHTETAKLKKSLEDLSEHLQQQTLARVEAENTVQTLREELAFKIQIHAQELSETRQTKITEIDGRLSEQYEARLQKSLHELREQHENQMRANREEVNTIFDAKVKNYQAEAARASAASEAAIEEIRKARNQIVSLNNKITGMEGQASAYLTRIHDLETSLENQYRLRSEDEKEIRLLREEMAQQLQDYQDLMDIKVSLDLEISTYGKLLAGEEERLDFSHCK